MAEARALKFCTKGDYIKFFERDDKSPLKTPVPVSIMKTAAADSASNVDRNAPIRVRQS